MSDRADSLVLLVGCPEGLVATWRDVAERLSVTVQACEPSVLRRGFRRPPFAIVVMEDQYRAEPGIFDTLTGDGPTSLVRLESAPAESAPDAQESAQRLLAEAVLEAAQELTESNAASFPG
ncbi:hypothetical protein [Chondromyces crocatus]|uniref:hypothetical protein n=1 Tax=Chondromyces crocatus TaxID=52 RepID=UPI0012E12E76|nr:hypothetical protein [Chondromyces crocatus]